MDCKAAFLKLLSKRLRDKEKRFLRLIETPSASASDLGEQLFLSGVITELKELKRLLKEGQG